VKDIGGALQYYNMKNRWNYGGGVEHIPYLTGQVYLQDTVLDAGGGTFVPATSVNQLLQRVYIDQAALFTQYPFSMTRRLELTANITHYGFETELFKTTFVGNTIVDQRDEKLSCSTNQLTCYKPVWFAEPTVALVGDNSFAAFTSPVQGERYRIQFTPTFGTVSYQSALLDYRRYFFMRPFTLAFRGISLGRYGSGAEDPNTTWPIYLGDETMMRGYGYGSFTSDECEVANATAGSTAAQNGCPAFQRLFGSKAAVVNAEFRIPLFGTEGFGLLNFPFLPTEVSPFFDAGVSYTNSQNPDFRFTRSANEIPTSCSLGSSATQQQVQQLAYYPCADRVPVFSTGLSFRFNLMGYAIMEAYIAHPFQRPKKDWVWGFQLAPGW